MYMQMQVEFTPTVSQCYSMCMVTLFLQWYVCALLKSVVLLTLGVHVQGLR